MTKPQMIRADTIDLQDQNSPSAKDHSRQPTSPAPLGDGPPAPHQAASLRNATLDEHGLHSRSPRASQDLSSKELQLLHEHSDVDEQDAAEIESSLGLQRNGENGAQATAHAEDGEIEDDGDEGLDDDMMDKISSSPSIEDGGYPHRPWPARGDSLLRDLQESTILPTDSQSISLFFLPSSPYLEAPHVLQKEENKSSEHHHHLGEYTDDERNCAPLSHESTDTEGNQRPLEIANESVLHRYRERLDEGSYDDDFDECSLDGFVIPYDDPLLDNSFDDATTNEFPAMQVDDTRTGFSSGRNDNNSEDKKDDEDDNHDDLLRSYDASEESDDDHRCDDDDEHDDDAKDISFDDSRFIDSGWGGECLRETEDIDFEFVYALHTFVATVEGQANATKGDTMVLLDDSNSYWWLVRVVKDSSIGYLPAEHIETPTERLARLNKHRNIDLSQTMLGDNPEKSRNPLKKAMRRRNAKNVQFAEPTYYEPSEVEYSTDEENEDEMEFLTTADAANDQGQIEQQIQNDSAVVEPLNVKSAAPKDSFTEDRTIDASQIDSRDDAGDEKSSTEIVDQSDDNTAPKSARRMRNTDSFYKDDTIETRKISLTPNLLRDDSVSGGTAAAQDNKARTSLEGSEKQGSIEKPKEEKKKEKKPSKFSGLFKRKDKKKTQPEDDDEWLNKDSTPSSRQSPVPKVSSESTSAELQQAPNSPPKSQQPSRQSSKLQKAQPTKSNSQRRRDELSAERPILVVEPAANVVSNAPKLEAAPISPPNLNPFDDAEKVEPLQVSQQGAHQQQTQQPSRTRAPEQTIDARVTSPSSEPVRNVFNPLRDALRPSGQMVASNDARPEKVKKAKNRMAIDSSDESDEDNQNTTSFPAAPQRQPPEPLAVRDRGRERLSESPIQVSPMVAPVHPPPGLVGDSSSHSEDAVSPVSPSSTPELIERLNDPLTISSVASAPTHNARAVNNVSGRGAQDPSTVTTPIHFQPIDNDTSTSNNTPNSQRTANTANTAGTSSTPEWSDALLRSYMESSSDDIRDLLVVVSDTSGVKVPGEEHPIVRSFGGERSRLVGMEARLDGLLKGLLEKRGVGQ